MPSPRQQLKSKRGYTDAHFMQLATSHDYFREAWGRLTALPDDELNESVADMFACWKCHQAEAESFVTSAREVAWFGQYADDPQRLIDECLADELRPWLLTLDRRYH